MRSTPAQTQRASALPAKHTLLLFCSEDEFVSALAPFVADGVEAEEAILAAAAPENLRALRSALEPTPPFVRFVDAADWCCGGPDTLGRWLSFGDDQLAGGRPGVRIVGEPIWPDDRSLHREIARFESAATDAFDHRPHLVVCAYDKRRLPASIIEHALLTHPGVIENGVAAPNERHVAPARLVRERLPELELPAGATARSVQPFEIERAAAFVQAEARRAGIDEQSVQRLVAAASEIVVNAFVHDEEPARVAIWSDAGRVLCQIEHQGASFEEPSLGFHPPFGDDDRWGPWLARRRCDALTVGTGSFGYAVRLTVERDRRRQGRSRPILARI